MARIVGAPAPCHDSLPQGTCDLAASVQDKILLKNTPVTEWSLHVMGHNLINKFWKFQ